MIDKPKELWNSKKARLEGARKELLQALRNLVGAGTLTQKEADALEAAIEDELIALGVAPFLSKR